MAMATDQEALNIRLPKELNAALKLAAEMEERSITGQVIVYLRKGLIADSYYQHGPVVAEPTPDPLPPAAVVQVPPTPPAKAPTHSRSIALVVRDIVDAAPLHGRAVQTFEKIVREHFPDIQSIEDARSKGPDAWLTAEASPAIMKGLFPELPDLEKTAAMLRQRARDQEARIKGRRDRRVGWSAG